MLPEEDGLSVLKRLRASVKIRSMIYHYINAILDKARKGGTHANHPIRSFTESLRIPILQFHRCFHAAAENGYRDAAL